MPWEPSSSSSRAITRSIGSRGGRPAAARPARGARACAGPRIELATADSSLPIASSETCAPPPVSSRTSARRRADRRPRRPRRRAPRSSAASETSRPTTRAPSAERDHHRRQADAAAAVHRDPLARRRAARPARPRGRRSRSGSRARRPRRSRRSSGSATRLTSAQSSATSSANEPQCGEARLALAVADLLVAGHALLAGAARAHERDGDARRPTRHARTSGPTASITPASSWPGTCGNARMSGSWPIQPCQSERHRPVASTRTTAPCEGGVGSATVATTGSCPNAS